MSDGVLVFPLHAPRHPALGHEFDCVGGQLAHGERGLVLELLVGRAGAPQSKQRLDAACRGEREGGMREGGMRERGMKGGRKEGRKEGSE